jgi:hypothetical protein
MLGLHGIGELAHPGCGHVVLQVACEALTKLVGHIPMPGLLNSGNACPLVLVVQESFTF